MRSTAGCTLSDPNPLPRLAKQARRAQRRFRPTRRTNILRNLSSRMSDTENEKPKLGMRAPLGLKRTVETGKVKQSFSHGRSNTVVVEVKRRRVLGPQGAPIEETAPPPAAAAAPEPVAAPTTAPKA